MRPEVALAATEQTENGAEQRQVEEKVALQEQK
jgi:hypothetical protein